MTKVRKEKVDAEEAADVTEKSYQELIANVNPIAQPLATKKLSKKLYKCVKKGESRTDFILPFAHKSVFISKLCSCFIEMFIYCIKNTFCSFFFLHIFSCSSVVSLLR